MRPFVLAGRIGYRLAHRLLRVYWFISRPQINGVKCVITDGDQVLLVRHTYGRREWDLPGGGMKRGEPPAGAAEREMEEELGVRIDDWRPLGAINSSQYHSRDTLHCFHAEVHDPVLTIDEIELAAADWFPCADLPREVGRHVRKIVAQVDGGAQDGLAGNARAAADSGASR